MLFISPAITANLETVCFVISACRQSITKPPTGLRSPASPAARPGDGGGQGARVTSPIPNSLFSLLPWSKGPAAPPPGCSHTRPLLAPWASSLASQSGLLGSPRPRGLAAGEQTRGGGREVLAPAWLPARRGSRTPASPVTALCSPELRPAVLGPQCEASWALCLQPQQPHCSSGIVPVTCRRRLWRRPCSYSYTQVAQGHVTTNDQ